MNAVLIAALALIQSPGQDSEEFQRRITPEVRAIQTAAPSVVFIETNVRTRRYDFFRGMYEGEGQSSGSGVVIRDEGYIVTNYHVVKDATSVKVRFDPAYDANVYPASVLSFDAAEDLALIKIDGDALFPPVKLGTSSDLMVGERVLAIGNPYGQSFTVSAGIISGLHRNIDASGMRFDNLIQTDASINPGNSGGPLLNINGELVGINTAMNAQAENIGFAIPVDEVWNVLQDQLFPNAQWRGWLGFELDEEELLVKRVLPGSPASLAGLEPGDRLLRVDGRELENSEDYHYSRLALLPHKTAELVVARGGDGTERSLQLVAWDRANGILFERMGLTLEPLILGQRVRVVKVLQVRPDGPADRLGIRPDDVIEGVRPRGGRGQVAQEPEQLALVAVGLRPGTELEVDIWRDDNGDGRFVRNTEHSELYQGVLTIE